jgi:hypothetical protein
MFENAPRLYLIDCLRKDLLGPRGGHLEQLPRENDPRDEYVTGILDVDPMLLSAQERDDEQEDEVSAADSDCGQDEEWDRPSGFTQWTPACDPRREPSAMGISWIVRGPLGSAIDVACTLAQYHRPEGLIWQRRPSAWVHRFELKLGAQEFPLEPLQARLLLRCRRRHDCFQITLMLVHQNPSTRNRTERLLFQPQLRVCLDSALERVALWEFETTNAGGLGEESRLRLLYRDQPVLARGHFCAAIWREIDPEGKSESPSPWSWEDGVLLDTADCQRFSKCDLRTEFLPAVAVQSPSTDWPEQVGPSPQRSAQKLADLAQQGQLQPALQPLVAGYTHWIDRLEMEVDTLPARYREQALDHVQNCRASRDRIQSGLDLLVEDVQARQAFAFANQAMALQARWKGSELEWRPFQIGFWLQCLQGLTEANHPDRQYCDLLWFPTGGGKTEAYLAMIAYVMGLRRLRHPGFDGTAVISRYTLRLLSIQQFRRALGLVTACEVLRIHAPERQWGEHRFSVGLWVGNNVTPNRMQSITHPSNFVPGALQLLTDQQPTRGHGEPAQVLDCPACGCALALSEEDLASVTFALHLVVEQRSPEPPPDLEVLKNHHLEALELRVHAHNEEGIFTLSFRLQGSPRASFVNDWWEEVRREWKYPPVLLAAQAARPGYFVLSRTSARAAQPIAYDFEIYCPDPGCTLNQQPPFFEKLPQAAPHSRNALQTRMPIPAVTVDEQIYGRPPSLLLATVDKFARLAYEPRAATLFGNVEYYHPYEGYYRKYCHRGEESGVRQPHPAPQNLAQSVAAVPPPELILQDELHLIDGPLGSMVGLYETVIDRLCSRLSPPKYVASTATVREAGHQVESLFQRKLRQFPSPGLSASDNFFALLPEGNPYQQEGSGRLYLGLCAPGRGSITPLVRCWATLLSANEKIADSLEAKDAYMTPVGYFNSLNQLALVAGLWRQYIPQRLLNLSQTRELVEPVELSSRMESERLPLLLKSLETPWPDCAHGVLATSMFGTGVDVSRLSLMVVHGQPKTTSSYIQATGRVGRQQPGLIITALSSSRPRELNHYEYFPGYHLQLYRGVEPVTVFPFAPRARERGMGPACVALLRQQLNANELWRDRSTGARRMQDSRHEAAVEELVELFCQRSQDQPEVRRPDAEAVRSEARQALDRWQQLAERWPDQLDFEEYTLLKAASKPVVLGDPQHVASHLDVVFRNAPQSLREVEPTTGFKV